MTDHSAVPDYDLDDSLDLESPEQYRALFDDTRLAIISLLSERAATTSELAQVLDKPKGTVGYHLKVLADAGLVHVVRTKRVRSLQAKYYGRTARIFFYDRTGEANQEPQRILATMSADIAKVPAGQTELVYTNMRYARVPAARVEEWNTRMGALITEFADEPRAGQTTFALGYALYPTTRPPLPEDSTGAQAESAQSGDGQSVGAQTGDGQSDGSQAGGAQPGGTQPGNAGSAS